MPDSPAIIFDLGKVLVDFDWSIAAGKIAARSLKPPADFTQYLATSPLLWQYESGLITREVFFQAIREATAFQGDIHEFNGYFAAIFTEIAPMTALQAGLRNRGFKTYIFSNTSDMAVEHVRRNFPFFKNFDDYILSYEVGAMKPQPKIYEAMEAMTGKRGADLIYIDDRPENIEAGAARGWRAILHEHPAQTQQLLEAHLKS